MAINPNTDFSSGAVLTSAQQNRFPRGVMALATSSTSYTLTTGTVISTGMTVTWTAVAGRNYKITYIEPQAETSTVASSNTLITIRATNAVGTPIAGGWVATPAAAKNTASVIASVVYSGGAGSTTFVGCSVTSNTTGVPILNRNVFQLAMLLVEDIGPA